VQDTLEPALAAIAGTQVDTTCAGRTDRGVHARAQVVHFDSEAERPESAWVRGVNTHLPDSIAVLWRNLRPLKTYSDGTDPALTLRGYYRAAHWA